MKKLLVLMLAILTVLISPEQFKMNYICPRQYRLCFYTDVCPAWKLCRKGRTNKLLKPRCKFCAVVFSCLPALHEGQAGNFYTLLPGCGRAYTAAQTVTATT